MRGQAACHWCGAAAPERSPLCALDTLDRPHVELRGRPLASPHDLGPVEKRPIGTHGVGSVARGIVLTELGWQRVSPEVLRRISR
jgi:hypothetical protein